MGTLGDWSFSIYLTHQPLMFTFYSVVAWRARGKPEVLPTVPPTGMLHGWAVTAVFVTVALALSALTYRFVEVPARQRINRWAAKPAVQA